MSCVAASRGDAQERFGSERRIVITPTFESWSFGDGLLQTTLRGDTVRLTRATQMSVPIAAQIWFGDRWQVDLSTAYVNGRVSLDSKDATLGKSEYTLNGLTDVKLGLTAHIVPDHVLVTVGLNATPGGGELESAEIEAVRVFAAPALSLEVPSMGLGRAATAGVVLAKQLGPGPGR